MKQSGNYYVAVIADIKDSKKAKNRALLQQKLNSVLNEINHKVDLSFGSIVSENPPLYYKEYLKPLQGSTHKVKTAPFPVDINQNVLASNFMITLGDEFQGLLSYCSGLMPIIDHIERSLFPQKIRFGIGIGEIQTEINRNLPFGMDGPAYHIAREMISLLKESERKTLEPSANIRIGIQGNDGLSFLLNTIFSLLTTIKERWTDRQVLIMNTFMHEGAQTQMKTAEHLGISQSSVQKALSASNFYTYQYALTNVSVMLQDIGFTYAIEKSSIM